MRSQRVVCFEIPECKVVGQHPAKLLKYRTGPLAHHVGLMASEWIHSSRISRAMSQTQGTFTVTVKERASESCSEADVGSSSLRELGL